MSALDTLTCSCCGSGIPEFLIDATVIQVCLPEGMTWEDRPADTALAFEAGVTMEPICPHCQTEMDR